MALTKKVVDAAVCPPDKARVIVWDGAVKGYGLACYRSGRKAYVLKFSIHGRQKWHTLGEHGPLTPQQARKRALAARGLVADGVDPTAEREREREKRTTIAELADDHLAMLQVKAQSRKNYGGLLDNHVMPTFGKFRPDQITEDDVRRWHRRMADMPSAANRSLDRLSAVLAEAEHRKLIPPATNPCRHVKRYPEQPRTRFLDTAELQRVGEALGSLESAGRVSPHAAAAIRLLLLTGCRMNEILRLRWQDVDVERGIANLPDAKGGGRPVFLSEPALAIIEKLRKQATPGHAYLIEGQKPGRCLTSVKGPWGLVRVMAQVTDCRIHDLRHTHAATGGSGGTSLLILGTLLGHKRASTTERYAHLAAGPVRAASEEIGAAITAALNGKADADEADEDKGRVH